MRKLESQAGVQAPTSDYPKGRIVNNQTLVNEEINGDIVQFFHRMTQLAGITENTLPDNVTNTFQLLEAMKWLIDNGNIKQAVISIGVWNMDTDAARAIVWPIPALHEIISMRCIINPDDPSTISRTMLDYNNAGNIVHSALLGSFLLGRNGGGTFDSVNYDSAVLNRGYIQVEYRLI